MHTRVKLLMTPLLLASVAEAQSRSQCENVCGGNAQVCGVFYYTPSCLIHCSGSCDDSQYPGTVDCTPNACHSNSDAAGDTTWKDFSFESIPSFLLISSGLLGLLLGFPIGVAGYKLWKYTIFLLGFIFLGVFAFVVAFEISMVQLNPSDQSRFAETGDIPTHVWVASGLSGLGVGVLGGFCFLGIYMCVIFCMGCGVGMTMFGYIISIVIASNLSAGTAQAAAENVNAVGTSVYVLAVVDVIIGIVVGVLFVKFQKWSIMLGTSSLGSSMVWTAILQSFAHCDPSWWQTVLVYLTTAGFFLIQWKYTSVGTEIDPKTGKVTVVVVNQPGITQPILTAPPGLPHFAPQSAQPVQYISQPQATNVITQPILTAPPGLPHFAPQSAQPVQNISQPQATNVAPTLQ